MKICKKCGTEKELCDFYKNKARSDGHAGVCKKCDDERNKIRQKQEPARKTRRKWVNNNIDSVKAYRSIYHPKYFIEHREEYKRRNDEWKAKNPERSKELGRKNFQKPSRKAKHKANQAMRRAVKLNATLPGYEDRLKLIYKDCPKGYHVDHIIPLRGKEVWGLHVPWNLQYLPALENIRKNNKVIL